MDSELQQDVQGTLSYACIGNTALRNFWKYKISPKSFVKTSQFISQLLMTVAASTYSIDDVVSLKEGTKKAKYDYLKYRISAERQILLVFGAKSQQFEDRIMASLDIDGIGILTALKLDRATRLIPPSASLFEILFILYHQQGINILPAASHTLNEIVYMTAVRNSLELCKSNVPPPEYPVPSSGFSSSETIESPNVAFAGISVQFCDVSMPDSPRWQLYHAFSGYGWHLVGGPCCIGKTDCVLSALRQYLHDLRCGVLPVLRSSVDIAVSVSDTIMDPLKLTSISSYRPGVDCLYVDLRCCHSATEVLSALATQWCLRGDSISELEIYLNKMLSLLRDRSVIVFDNVGSAQCSAVLSQMMDSYSKTLCIVIVTAGSTKPRLSSLGAHQNSLGSILSSKMRHSPVNDNQRRPFFFDSETQDSISGMESMSMQDEVFVDVMEGLGGSSRLDSTPYKKTVFYFNSLLQDELESLAKALIADANYLRSKRRLDAAYSMPGEGDRSAPIKISMGLEQSDASMAVRLSGDNIGLLKVVCSLPKKAFELVEDFARSRGYLSQPIGSQLKLTADDIFLHTGSALFEDIDCLYIVAGFIPCMHLVGVGIDADLGWALCQSVFIAVYSTRANFGNSTVARSRFNNAWSKLLSAGWLESYAGITSDVAWTGSTCCISVAASQSHQLYEHAATRLLDSCRFVATREELLSLSWDSYYNYWVKQLESINLEFVARGQSICLTGRSVEGNCAQGFVECKISIENRPYSKYLMRELIDLLDKNIWHYFRLFSLWFTSHSSRDFQSMSAISIATSRLSSKHHVFEGERMSLNADTPNLGKLSLESSPRHHRDNDLDEKTFQFLPELRASLGSASHDKSVADGSSGSRSNKHAAHVSGKMSGTNRLPVKKPSAVTALEANIESENDEIDVTLNLTRAEADSSSNNSHAAAAILLAGPISNIFKETGHPKLNSVFTQLQSEKSPRLMSLLSRSNSTDSYNDGIPGDNHTHSLRSKEKERKKLVMEYITDDPSAVAGAMVEHRLNVSTGTRNSLSPMGNTKEEGASAAQTSGKFRKPTSLQDLLLPLAQAMGIALSRRIPIFRAVEIMKNVTAKMPRSIALVKASIELAELMSLNTEEEDEANTVETCFVNVIELADSLIVEEVPKSIEDQILLQYYSLYGSYCLSRILARNHFDDAGLQLLEQVIFRLRALANSLMIELEPTTEMKPSLISHTETYQLVMQLLPDAIALQGLIISKTQDVQNALGGLNSELDMLHHSTVSTSRSDAALSPLKSTTPTPLLASSSEDLFSNHGSMRGIPAVSSTEDVGSSLSSPGSPRVLGSSHLNRVERSKGLFEEAATLYLLQYGENSIRAGEMHTSIGDMMRLLGRLEGARSHYEAALNVFKTRYEGPHPRIGFALVGLADTILQESQRESLARRLLEEALLIFQTVYSEDDPCIRATANALAQLLTTQMRYDRAISLYQQSLLAARRALANAKGPTNKDRETQAIPPLLVTIASLHNKVGHFHLAVPLYQEALTTYRDLFGYEHQTIADTMCLLASALGKVSNTDKEESPLSSTYHTQQQQLMQQQRQRQEDGATISDNGSEHYQEAVHIIQDAIKIYKAIDMEDSSAAVRARKQLARLHEKNGNFEAAKGCFEAVLRTYVNIHIGSCEELGDTYIAYSRILCANDEHGEAITLYNQALSLYSQLFGDLHIKVAETLYSLGSAHIALELFEEAQPYFERALVLFTELSPECFQIGDCNNSIGYICQELDEYDEARDCYRQALSTYIKCFGKFHGSVANVVNNMATVFDDLDEHEAAAHFYNQSIGIMKELYGSQSPLLLQSMENLASLYEDLGVTEAAAQLHSEADEILASMDPSGESDNNKLVLASPSAAKTRSSAVGRKQREDNSTSTPIKTAESKESMAEEAAAGGSCIMM